MQPICRALLGIGLFVCAQAQAGAFTAYVSNEKSNTVSIVNTDKLATIGTIKVGQRPRGIELTKDGKFILVAVGDDDNGGLSYLRTEPAPHTDSYTAWDGRSVGWYVFAERDWGNLYLAPRMLPDAGLSVELLPSLSMNLYGAMQQTYA